MSSNTRTLRNSLESKRRALDHSSDGDAVRELSRNRDVGDPLQVRFTGRDIGGSSPGKGCFADCALQVVLKRGWHTERIASKGANVFPGRDADFGARFR